MHGACLDTHETQALLHQQPPLRLNDQAINRELLVYLTKEIRVRSSGGFL